MWISLNENTSIEEISKGSYQKAIILFKHSTRCSVSFSAKRYFESAWKGVENEELYLLDLISYRSISNEIEQTFGVRHESPQVLVIKNGECLYHASHGAIDPKKVEGIIQDI